MMLMMLEDASIHEIVNFLDAADQNGASIMTIIAPTVDPDGTHQVVRRRRQKNTEPLWSSTDDQRNREGGPPGSPRRDRARRLANPQRARATRRRRTPTNPHTSERTVTEPS